jgi:PAS domain S-box-containing protein
MTTNNPSGKILVADDEKGIRMMLVDMLTIDGHTVYEAANGQEATEKYQELRPDLVLLDGMMPVLSGFDACKRIKTLPGGSRTPILMLTALEDSGAVEQAFEAGATDYITKPIRWPLLRQRVKRLVESYQAEESLHRTREILQNVLSSAPLFFHAIDAKGIFTLTEGHIPLLPDTSREDIQVGKSFFELYHDQSRLVSDMQSALEGQSFHALYENNGRSVQVWYAPLRDPAGSITGAMAVGMEMGESSWKDSALLESQRVMTTLMSNLPGMAYRSTHTPHWEFTFVSEGCHELTGYHAADLIGNRSVRYIDLIHPDDRDSMWAGIQKGIQENRPFQLTYRIKTAEGQEKWVWEQGQKVDDPAQTLVEGFVTDITERKEFEKALARERNLMRILIDNLPDYVFVKDTEGRFIVTNIANTRYLGKQRPQEVIGRTDFDFFPQDRAEAYRQRDLEIMQNHKDGMSWEQTEEDLKSGRKRWYAITKVPFVDPQDKVLGIAGMIRDITRDKEATDEMRLANEQLIELNRLKSHFVLTMSHELRTPLNSILGYSELLLQETLGPLNDKQRDRLERVVKNGEDLLALIDDVLDISKIQTGQMDLTLRPTQLQSLIQECFNGYSSTAKKKGLDFQVIIEPDLSAVVGDSTAILKILTNLTSNAIKFTAKGGVKISARRLEKSDSAPREIDPNQAWILITVEDTGIGISPEDQRTLFNEFRQIDSTPTREQGGTGLGLALSYKLVSLMHGRMWLESALGRGSQFYVLLPAVD